MIYNVVQILRNTGHVPVQDSGKFKFHLAWNSGVAIVDNTSNTAIQLYMITIMHTGIQKIHTVTHLNSTRKHFILYTRERYN